jgi:hypothetical protein
VRISDLVWVGSDPLLPATRPSCLATSGLPRGLLPLHSSIRTRFECGQVSAVNKPEPIDLSTLQRPPSKSFENGLARDSADLSSLTDADIIFGKIAHGCRLTIMLPYRSSIRSGANMRPATARRAPVPWLNESRCARDDLENASPGQADCLAFFIALVRSTNGKENASNVSSVASISTSQPSKTAERGRPHRQPPLDSSISPDNTRSIGVGRGERHGRGAILRHRPCRRTAMSPPSSAACARTDCVQAESEGEAVQIALEMLESGKSVM